MSDNKASGAAPHGEGAVCFCNSNVPWGGGEKWHLEGALSLARRGRRVILLCHPDGELYQRARALPPLPGLRVEPLRITRFSFLNPFTRRRLTAFFRKERVRAVILNLPADLKAAAPAARAAGVGHVVYRRGSALPVRDSALNRHLYGRVITRLIVNSEATRRLVLVNNPRLIPLERITVLPNGIDVAAFDAALAAAKPMNFVARPFVLGNAGRLNRQKGQHLLLDLTARLAKAGLPVRAVIAGTGEREAELKGLAASLGIEERVEFPGFMENLAPFWRGIDLFVLTSLWEGFGNVLIEAMLAEKPVLAFAVSNLPELVRDGENGFLFPLPEEERAHSPEREPAEALGDSPKSAPLPHPLDDMAERVLELATKPERRRALGRAGRAFALRFDQESCMDRLEELLEREGQGKEERAGYQREEPRPQTR